jgi:hypothetical protein
MNHRKHKQKKNQEKYNIKKDNHDLVLSFQKIEDAITKQK